MREIQGGREKKFRWQERSGGVGSDTKLLTTPYLWVYIRGIG
jgi:hypothetical protein